MRITAYVIALSLAFCPAASEAHDWFTGKQNPKTGYGCCGGSDCTVIGENDYWMEGGNYLVKWRDGKTYFIPANQVQPTEDPEGKAAACVWNDKLQCLFIPLSY